MTPLELQHYLHTHIPLSKAMEISVLEAGIGAVVLSAPLAPNINHRETVFGGSSYAVAILAAWGLLHLRMIDAGQPSRLVIQSSTMSYTVPIDGTFTAIATQPEAAVWERFLRVLKRMGKARIALASDLRYQNQAAGHFEGEFVALGAAVRREL